MSWRSSPRSVFTAIGVITDVPQWGFYLLGLVWWIEELELDPFRLIMLGTALEASLLLSEIPTGVLADRFSRQWSVVVAFVLMGAAMILHAATTNYGVLIASQVMFGLGWAFRSGADIAWLTDQQATHDFTVGEVLVRRQRIILLSAAVSLPVVIVMGSWSLRGSIIVLGGVVLLGGLVVGPLLVAGESAPESHGMAMADIARTGWKITRNRPTIRRVVGMVFLLGLGAEAIDRLGFQRFLTRGDFGEASLLVTGVLFVCLALGGAATVRVVEARLSAGVSYNSMALMLIVLAVVGVTAVIVAPAAGIAAGLLLQDSTREALVPVTAAWANPSTDDDTRATVHSFISQAEGVGEAVGGLCAASIVWATSVSAALLWTVVLFSLAAVVTKPKEPTVAPAA